MTTYAEPIELLKSHLALSGLNLEESQWQKLTAYCQELAEYNLKVNLVGNTSPEILVGTHVLDGLTVARLINQEELTTGRLIDIGSGGGFPAMVLAIACPKLKVTMVESIGKKCRFLSEAADKLGLDAEVINGRAEELGHEPGYRGRFNLATARAVGTLKLTCELCQPFLKVGGLFIAQKTRQRVGEELAESQKLMTDLPFKLERTVEFEGELAEKLLLLIRKPGPTKAIYPRPWKKIQA